MRVTMITKLLLVAVALCATTATVNGASIYSNPITAADPSLDNPFTTGDVADPHLSVSGIGRGAGISGNAGANRYNSSQWDLSALNATDYFSWTLTPDAGFEIDFEFLAGTWQRSTTGPVSYALRSSLDSFAADIVAGAVPNGTSAFSLDLSAAAFDAVDSAITFQLYAWGGTSAAGTFSINDFTFDGEVVPEPASLVMLSMAGLALLGLVRLRS